VKSVRNYNEGNRIYCTGVCVTAIGDKRMNCGPQIGPVKLMHLTWRIKEEFSAKSHKITYSL